MPPREKRMRRTDRPVKGDYIPGYKKKQKAKVAAAVESAKEAVALEASPMPVDAVIQKHLDKIKAKKASVSVRKCDDPDFPLTKMERDFVDQYIIDYSPRRAIIRAGIPMPGKSYTPDKVANRLLHKANVRRAVRTAEVQDGERYRELKDRCIREAARIAFQDAREIYNIDKNGVPSLKPADEIDGKLIKSLYAKSRTKKDDNGFSLVDLDMRIDTWDKDKALAMLGRWLGMEKLDVTSGGRPIEAAHTSVLILDRNGKEALPYDGYS